MNKLSSVLIARIRALNHNRRLIPVKLHPRLQALPAIRAVLFDVYGTLVDSGAGPLQLGDEMVLKRRMRGILRQAGFSTCFRDAGISVMTAWREKILIDYHLARAGGIDYPELDIRNIWRQVLHLGIQRGWIMGSVNAGTITRIALEFEGVQNPVVLMPGIENALARLRQRGIKMGIVSNAQFYTPLILQVLFGASLAKVGFDRSLCIWSYRLGRAKPSPCLLNLALERIKKKYGLTPKEVLVIGNDWNNDLAPARRAGCRTALLAGSIRSFPHPQKAVRRWRPDLLLTNWTQLGNIWIKNIYNPNSARFAGKIRESD